MRVAGLLVAGVVLAAPLLAGCLELRYEKPCAEMTIDPAATALAWGAVAAFTVRLTNCGDADLVLAGSKSCPHHAFGARVQDASGHGHVLGPDGRPEVQKMCQTDWSALVTVPVGGTHETVVRWTGEVPVANFSLLVYPPPLRPAAPGAHAVDAFAVGYAVGSTNSHWTWTARAVVDLTVPEGVVTEPAPCVRLDLLPTRAVVWPGAGVTLTATLTNCGMLPVEVFPPLCASDDLVAALDAGNRTWYLGSAGAARAEREPAREWSFVGGDGSGKRGVAACDRATWTLGWEDSRTTRFVWNGTVDDGSGGLLPPGVYDARAEVATALGPREARAVVRVLDAPPSWRTLDAGSHSGMVEGRFVLESEEAWRAHWEKHRGDVTCAGTRACTSDAPAVDFAAERVLALHDSARPDGCYALRLLALRQEADRVVAEVGMFSPSQEQVCSMAFTNPFQFVTIPIDPRPVAFEDREVVGRPPP